jgi:hypothetical protein
MSAHHAAIHLYLGSDHLLSFVRSSLRPILRFLPFASPLPHAAIRIQNQQRRENHSDYTDSHVLGRNWLISLPLRQEIKNDVENWNSKKRRYQIFIDHSRTLLGSSPQLLCARHQVLQ